MCIYRANKTCTFPVSLRPLELYWNVIIDPHVDLKSSSARLIANCLQQQGTEGRGAHISVGLNSMHTDLTCMCMCHTTWAHACHLSNHGPYAIISRMLYHG